MVPSSQVCSWRDMRMQLDRKNTTARIAGVLLTLLCTISWAPSLAADDANSIAQSPDYFPDTIGSHWEYRGQITEGPLQTIEHKFFTNVSSVTGTRTLRGMTVTVFHDTNPGNHGPADRFYRRDVVNEKADAQGTSTVVGFESITVPAGTFKDAVKVEARMRMQIHVSGAQRTVTGTDVMTAWFAKGVGLVKYAERQELSPLQDRGVITEITEELESYEIKPSKPSLSRSKPSTEGLFANNSRNQKLQQVIFSSRLRPHS